MRKIDVNRDPEFSKRIPNRRVKVPTLKHLRDKEEGLKRKLRWFLDLRKKRGPGSSKWWRTIVRDYAKELRGVQEQIRRRSPDDQA